MSQLIHKAILAIQGDIHSVGIGKLRRNQEQKFDFRGIDDALSAFAPLLTAHKVILSPVYGGITVAKRQTKSGGNTYNVKLHGTFTFTHADDGSTHTVGPVYGEANDGQDKAVSKAESIALRQMFFIAFCVPHEPVIGGDPDAGNAELPDDVPEYLDWKASIAEQTTLQDLRAVKKEMTEKFKGVVPSDLVSAYNVKFEALKMAPAEAAP